VPLYDYDCSACGRRFEVVHGVHAERPTVCPICGSGPIRKAISAAAVHYKGTGWAKKERRATVSPGTAKASDERPTPEAATRNDDGGTSAGSPAPTATKASSKPAEAGATGSGSGSSGNGSSGAAD
jgi:putative FmdB family regulatory protein